MKIIVISSTDAIHLVPINEIVFFQKKQARTTFHLMNHKLIESNMPMSHFENKLHNATFLKINSYQIVNINYIDKIVFQKPMLITLKDSTTLMVATDKTDELIQLFDKIQHIQCN